MRQRALILAAVAVTATLLAASTGCGSSTPPAPAAPSVESLAGVWTGELERNGQTGHFALELSPTEGDLRATLSLPDIEAWEVPMGSAVIEGNQIQVGPLALRYDAQRRVLAGTIPETIVPVHEMAVELRRVPALERPASTGPAVAEVTPIWTHETGSPVWAGVSVSDGIVIVGNDAGTVHGLDSRGGQELWRLETRGAIRARPVIEDDSVLVHSDDGYLYRLDASTGKQRWRVELGPEVERLGIGDKGFRYDSYASAPTIADGIIFVGHDDGSLHALDASTGEHRWKIQAGDAVTSTPAVGDGRVYFGSFDGIVRAVAAATGAPVWEHDTGAPVPSSPAVHEGRVIVGSRSFDLLALGAADGVPVWSYYYWFSWVESSPTIVDGVVYIGSSDAQLVHAIDAFNGRLLWAFDTGGSAWGKPAVSEDAVFLGSVGVAGYIVDHQGGLFAIDRDTGRGLWRFNSPPPEGAKIWGFASSPAVGEELVFAGGLDGRVYAFPRRPAGP